MATNNFKPFANGSNANVTSQSDYEALSALSSGFQAGKASSAQINKALRQSSVMSYVLAQFISDSTSSDVLDNGIPASILAGMKSAMTNLTPGRLINIQVFNHTSPYTPTTGMRFILAHLVGAGGASGGTPATNSTQTGGVAAGNSGAYSFIRAYASDIGAGKAVTVGTGGESSVNGYGTAGGTTSILDIADITGGYGSAPGSVSNSAIASQPAYGKPTVRVYNRTEIIISSTGSQASNFLQASTGTGTGWIAPASQFPGGERGRGGDGIFVNINSPALAGRSGNDGGVIIMEYA